MLELRSSTEPPDVVLVLSVPSVVVSVVSDPPMVVEVSPVAAVSPGAELGDTSTVVWSVPVVGVVVEPSEPTVLAVTGSVAAVLGTTLPSGPIWRSALWATSAT